MTAIEDAQDLGDSRLHTKGNTCEASLGEAFKRRLVHAFGVRFYGNFRAGGDPKVLIYPRKETSKNVSGQERGGASTEEDARGGALRHTGVTEDSCSHTHFSKGALVVALSVSSGAETDGVGIEVTVAATNLTEGNVYVDG